MSEPVPTVTFSLLEGMLHDGVAWLKGKSTSTLEQMSARNVALLVLAYCYHDISKHCDHIEALKARLVCLQKIEDGSWNNELWDTAWALLALTTQRFLSLGKGPNFRYSPIQNGLFFIQTTKNEARCNWQGELYETILTALVLLRMRYAREYPFIRKAVEWVATRQNPDGCWVNLYDTALAVSLFAEAKAALGIETPVPAQRAVAALLRWPPEAEDTWVNACVLAALIDYGMAPTDAEIVKRVAWFAENQVDGSWSSSEDEQAMGIISLAKVRDNLRIRPGAGPEELSWAIALSFAGEDRAYVERVAQALRQREVSVFYDKFEEIDLWGKNLYDHLDNVYRVRAKYCVIFVSSSYAEKAWTTHERRSAQARALKENAEYILPVRFDDTDVPGLLPTIGYLDARKYSPEELAELIIKKVL